MPLTESTLDDSKPVCHPAAMREGMPCPIGAGPCPGFCIYSSALNGVDVGIAIVNTAVHEIVFLNAAAAKILDSAGIGRSCSQLLPMLVEDSASLPGVPKSKQVDGHILGFTPYRIHSSYYCVFLRDVTEQQRLESIAEAVNTSENIGYIFSGIRHEIGNPLNSMKMTLSVLRTNLDRYSRDRVLEYVDRALAELARIEYLLRALKNFSLFERPSMETFLLTPFLERFVRLVESDLAQRRIRFTLHTDLAARCVCADPRALHHALLNLVTNSADALDGCEAPTISIWTERMYGRVLLHVEDNGCGMTEEQMANLFRPFFTSKRKGTGLGMVITKKTLARMSAEISVQSKLHVGTDVCISLSEGCPDEP